MKIAILLFEGITALDAVGPYEVLGRIPGARISFVAEEAGVVRTDTRSLGLTADLSIAESQQPDIVLVPGGKGSDALLSDGPVHAWLREAHAHSTWTTSVCTGSLVLAAAGLLPGKRATSHWLALEQLASLGATPVSERVVFDGKLVTAAGVSAGIDMALELTRRIGGDELAQAIQLGIEYDPQPPFDSGSPEKAPAEIVRALRARSRFL